jgi:glyoxylase-like metal-dependent hydrolase (beta-lactamase superfamily II)
MERITDSIHRLGSHAHNFFLLTEGGKATVIDAGCSKELPKLVAALGSMDMALDDVEAVLITHAHADHFGFAAEAAERGTPVKVHEEERTRANGTYEGRFSVTTGELRFGRLATWRNFLPMMRLGVTGLTHTDDVETVTDGEVLDLPGRPVVVHTPGHTEGHIAFHLPDRSTAFVGDALASMPLFGGPTGPQMIEDEFHLDPALARESLGRLSTLAADLVLPGHGEPLRMPIAEATARAGAG